MYERGIRCLSEKELRQRICENLYLLRTYYGYTQQQIASFLGCERSTYTYLEKGKTFLSVYHLYILSSLYRLPPEAMWSELQAIDTSCRKLGGWRLHRCDLYVTLEPCPMCAGAIINSRIERVVYGTADPKAGSCGSVVNLSALPYNHRPALTAGVLQPECAGILTDFFRRLRSSGKG